MGKAYPYGYKGHQLLHVHVWESLGTRLPYNTWICLPLLQMWLLDLSAQHWLWEKEWP